MNQIRILFIVVALSAVSLSSFAQKNTDENVYRKMIEERSWKIVQKLQLPDTLTAVKVRDIIAGHYIGLNDIYKQQDSLKTSRPVIDSAVSKLHQPFLNRLSVYLSPDQVIEVKDGLTYGVLPVTYAAYLDMLPQLTAVQKNQIMIWLTEAREKAMDAESSEKKHGWFKKYKGRINNYLSANGIDMKKEGDAWQERIKARAHK